jgi:tetratricopeptide (TPR) repeat protein
VSLLDAELWSDAIQLLEELYNEKQLDRFGLTLAQAYLNVGKLPEARKLLKTLSAAKNEDQGQEHRPSPRLDLLFGVLNFEEGNIDDALDYLRRAEAADNSLPRLHTQLGYVYLRRRRWTDAERAFSQALEMDGDNARACHGLSVALLRTDRYAEAADLALRAVGLQHYFPAAHFQLGLILTRLNWPERAAQAFETGLRMRPNAIVAHRYLSRLYGRLGQDDKARHHREAAASILERSKSFSAELAPA